MAESKVRTLHLISNSKSGQGTGGSIADIAAEVCRTHGVSLINYDISEPGDIEVHAEKAVQAAINDQGVVVAAGGDGTIRSLAQKAYGTDVRFAVVPCGTFNYFARNHRIPEDPKEALTLALTGATCPVRVGEVNGQVFLINASLGLYVRALRDREIRTERWGRNRLVAVISTAISLFSPHRLLSVDMLSETKDKHLLTPMVFIGNNPLQLKNLQLSVAQCLKQDKLAVMMLKPLTKLDVLRMLFKGLIKTIENEERIESFCVSSLNIFTRRTQQMVALDGEFFQMTTPLEVQALPKALNIVIPPKEASP